MEIVSMTDSKGTFSVVNSFSREIYVKTSDGKKAHYPIPKHIRCCNVTQTNGGIFIDGYEFKNGEFKRTLKAFWHLFF